jgi:phosphatidylglycerol:prolipoprotein diacylglycerol transferase
MRPVLFEIPGLGWPIYGFGFMMVIAFLVAIGLARRRGRQIGMDPDDFSNLGMIALVAGIVGCRLFYVVHYWKQDFVPVFKNDGFWAGLLHIVNVRSGGLEWFGGFLLTIAMMSLYARVRRISIGTSLDVCGTVCILGLGIGRIGCLLNGCCYGGLCPPDFVAAVRFPKVEVVDPADPTALPRTVGSQPFVEHVQAGWLANVPGVPQWSLPVHPAQIYELVGDAAIFFFLWYYFHYRRRPGECTIVLLALYGALRFTLEFVRMEPREIGGVLTVHQVIALSIFAVALAAWVWIQRLPAVKETYDKDGRPVRESPVGQVKPEAAG